MPFTRQISFGGIAINPNYLIEIVVPIYRYMTQTLFKQSSEQSILLYHSSMQAEDQCQFKQYPYRYVVLAIFSALAFVNGVCWVVVTSISVQVRQAYDQSELTVSMVPMCYMIVYIFINFPANWVLDVRGIKKGIVIGAVLTAIGAGIRCFVDTSFAFVIVGQVICAIAQPFILNAPTKIAIRWFILKDRALALAILSVANVLGVAIGFVIPSFFVDAIDPKHPNSQSIDSVKSQFSVLLIFEFFLTLIPATLVLLSFKESPPSPACAESIERIDYLQTMKDLFKQKKFLTLLYAFGTVMGAFSSLGSLLDDIFDCYDYSSAEVSSFGASMTLIGVVSSGIFGAYVEKSRKFHKIFVLLSTLGIIASVGLPLIMIIWGQNFAFTFIMVGMTGIAFIPFIPLSFDYGTEILFPTGQALITGCLMAFGNLIGALQIVIGQQAFNLGREGNTKEEDQRAGLLTVILINGFLVSGMVCYYFFNGELIRTNLQKERSKRDERGVQQTLISAE